MGLGPRCATRKPVWHKKDWEWIKKSIKRGNGARNVKRQIYIKDKVKCSLNASRSFQLSLTVSACAACSGEALKLKSRSCVRMAATGRHQLADDESGPRNLLAHVSACLSVHWSALSWCSAIRCLNRSLNCVVDVLSFHVKGQDFLLARQGDATALRLLPAFRQHYKHSGRVTLVHSTCMPLIDYCLINGRVVCWLGNKLLFKTVLYCCVSSAHKTMHQIHLVFNVFIHYLNPFLMSFFCGPFFFSISLTLKAVSFCWF